MASNKSANFINIISVSDFPFLNSGLYSCLIRILKNLDKNTYNIYSDQKKLNYRDIDWNKLPDFELSNVIIFTHLEYSKLKLLLSKYKGAIVYVADWPGVYWDLVKKNENCAKGLLGKIRFFYRINNLPKENKYIFVAEKDCLNAIKYGFINSKCVPLGVDTPILPIKLNIDTNVLCFTGNFRYEPNLNAAIELISFAKKNIQFTFVFAGYYAQDLEIFEITENIKIFQNVPSIINFLIDLRPIYVSNIKYGAGAKNKILEAIISACPVIATSESLDESLLKNKSIIQFNNIEELREKINHVKKNIDFFENVTRESSNNIINERSWNKISKDLFSLLNE